MRFILCVLLVFFTILQYSCGSGSKTEAENYKNAYLVTVNDTTFLKLKGKRVLLHDPGTYEDSTLIPIPKSEDGRIEGKDVPVEKGHFNFKGYILISRNILTVNLLVDDTADKKLRPLSWNGEYTLIRE